MLGGCSHRKELFFYGSGFGDMFRAGLATLQCALSYGTIHAFYVTKQQLSELRFVAARCLKEMDDVETRLPAMP